MGGKMNFSVTGGSVSIGQVVQGDAVTVTGDVAVEQYNALLRNFRDQVATAVDRRGLGTSERAVLETRLVALESALRDAKAGDTSTLKRLRNAVEDFRGAFGWVAPLAKALATACVPGVAALLK